MIMLKKLAITVAAGAIMLSAAAGVFAYGGTHNWANVTTSVDSESNTGSNVMGMGGNFNSGLSGNGVAVDSHMHTGNSTTNTVVVTAANTNLGSSHHSYTHNGAEVTTGVTSLSNTGNNGMGVGGSNNGFGSGNGVTWDSSMHTGNANTNTAVVTVVNTNINFH